MCHHSCELPPLERSFDGKAIRQPPDGARLDVMQGGELRLRQGEGQRRTGLDKAREGAETREFEDEVDLIDSLRTVVDRLAVDLTGFPREGSWRDFLSATLALLGRWIERGQLTEERQVTRECRPARR